MSTPDGKSIVTQSAFSYECATGIRIRASRERVWKLIVEPGEQTKWNSMLIGIDGAFSLNHTFRIKTTLDPTRSIKLKVSEFVPMSRMVWADGWLPFYRGERLFSLEEKVNGEVEVRFVQSMRGFLMLMISGSVPEYPKAFEKMVRELKEFAEREFAQ